MHGCTMLTAIKIRGLFVNVHDATGRSYLLHRGIALQTDHTEPTWLALGQIATSTTTAAPEHFEEGTGMKLTLPYPPSANRYWRSCRGRTFVSKEAQAYKHAVAVIAQATYGKTCHVGPVEITGSVYRPRATGDLDNRIKVLVDALQGIAYANDSQVKHIDLWMHDEPKLHKKHKREGRVEVTITSLE